MLYTRKGDDGMSGLFGTTERLPKNHPLYDALGALDELNSLLGLCRTRAGNIPAIAAALLSAQQRLFVIQAELAGADKTLSQNDTVELENIIETLERAFRVPRGFVVPGATELEAQLDYSRAVARRAERAVVGARVWYNLSAESTTYLNRLSSLLYALARFAAAQEGVEESAPKY